MGWKRERMLRRMYVIYITIQREALKTSNIIPCFQFYRIPPCLAELSLFRGASPCPAEASFVLWSSALLRGTLTCLAELYLASRSPTLPRGALSCLTEPWELFALPCLAER
jgi:hypothetical protein